MIKLGLANSIFRQKVDTPSPAVIQALAEAILWCSLPRPQSCQLRSVALDPCNALEGQQWDGMTIDEVWINAKYESYQQAVSQLTQRRANLLSEMNLRAVEGFESAQARGRLLIYFPMETVDCGAAEMSSERFFDVHDAPPWDTWFWYSKGAIFSWIAQSEVSRAQAGIDANPVDCIHWADWRDLSRLTT